MSLLENRYRMKRSWAAPGTSFGERSLISKRPNKPAGEESAEFQEAGPNPLSPAASVLVTVLDPVRAGAEAIALKVAHVLSTQYSITVASLRSAQEIPRGLGWRGPTGDLRDLLFGRYRLLHTHLFLPGLAARLRRLWDPHIRWVHTVHYHGYQTVRWGRIKRWLDTRFIFPDADVLIAVSPLVMRTLEGYPRARTILNSVDQPDQDPLERPGRDPPDPPTLATVAMLRPEKGIEDLLEAVALLKDRGRQIRLRIAGDGPLRAALQIKAEALGVVNSVTFEGFLDDLDYFYQGTDLYVQPSREESFGMATLEAMARGLPLVVAASGNLPALVDEGSWGAVARPEPGESRPAALARTISDALERLGELREGAIEGWKTWRERLNPEQLAAAHLKAVSDALLPRVTMIQPIVTHATGGLQRQLRIQTLELARLGHRITLLQRKDPLLATDQDRRSSWSHLKVLQVPDPAWLPSKLRGAVFLAGAFLRLLARRSGTDVFHAHQLYSPTLVGAWAKACLGGALVTKVTAAGALGEARQIRKLPFRRLRLRTFRRIDRVIVLHQAMGEEMAYLAIPPERILEIPNSVEIPPRAAPITPTSGGPLPLLWVGRMSSEKGVELLLEAGRLLKEAGMSVEIHLVGGPDPDRNAEPRLRKMAEGLRPEIPIEFHGIKSDLSDFYSTGPIFVLPSRSEGMSNALLEAMAWGLPCVVSDIPANRALVDGATTGLLFRDGDAASLAGELERLHLDLCAGEGLLARSIGAGARKKIEEGFSAQGVARRLSKLYREISP